MHEPHRVRNGLNEWNRVPAGYIELPLDARVQAGDVQRLNDEWFAEYPARGVLIGKLRGAGGRWFRKAPNADARQGPSHDH